MAKSNQLARFEARMNAIPKAVREAVQPALAKNADELASAMKHLAEPSRDTGALIDSIHATLPGERTPPYSQPGGNQTASELEALVTAGNSEVRYAHLVEYGTSDTDAQPFFWPSVRLLKKRLNNRMKRAISKAVRTKWDQ
ncbi:HK97 gp10 family phage protein [Devosia rhodophyticola]|uniref:HK97 gp10 family phage protein n=1 Tax=Devosia rhodophyticola TaxID=3026423 RepID=A0ABY7YXV3_9HYPH|nr:HK97-gp10 family putative phage morphogenesis protein [Devosia rhodophyticola]WDR05625.1 HK97 gp10 family phage protein [Devosia rhodophyticola]